MIDEDTLDTVLQSFLDGMNDLDKMKTYDACQLLLCACDLGIRSPAIDARIRRLEREAPPVDTENEDLLQAIIRQLVFTVYDTAEVARKAFIDHWLNRRGYKGKGIVEVSFLVSLGLENIKLLTPKLREYVRGWHLRHPGLKADRLKAWAAYELRKSGHIEAAKRTSYEVLRQRESNGSWSDDLPRTIACAYPLAKSKLVSSKELASTVTYILSKLRRRFVYGIANQASALKVLAQLDLIPKERLERIRTEISRRGDYYYSCFISYSHTDNNFALRLDDELKRRGISCWLDEHEILPGDVIDEAVNHGIRFSDKVLLCCSKASLASWWVGDEIDKALEKERQLLKERGDTERGEIGFTIIPLNLDGCLFDWQDGRAATLRKRLAADFNGWEYNDAKFQEQVERLVKALRTDEGAREKPPESKLISRPTVISTAKLPSRHEALKQLDALLDEELEQSESRLQEARVGMARQTLKPGRAFSTWHILDREKIYKENIQSRKHIFVDVVRRCLPLFRDFQFDDLIDELSTRAKERLGEYKSIQEDKSEKRGIRGGRLPRLDLNRKRVLDAVQAELAILCSRAGEMFTADREVGHLEHPFTSEGFSWETLGERELSPGTYGVIVNVKPLADLPQPLQLQVQCSTTPKTVIVSFYEDLRTLRLKTARFSQDSRGKTVNMILIEPKLVVPGFLSIQMHAEEPIEVQSIFRLR